MLFKASDKIIKITLEEPIEILYSFSHPTTDEVSFIRKDRPLPRL